MYTCSIVSVSNNVDILREISYCTYEEGLMVHINGRRKFSQCSILWMLEMGSS